MLLRATPERTDLCANVFVCVFWGVSLQRNFKFSSLWALVSRRNVGDSSAVL